MNEIQMEKITDQLIYYSLYSKLLSVTYNNVNGLLGTFGYFHGIIHVFSKLFRNNHLFLLHFLLFYLLYCSALPEIHQTEMLKCKQLSQANLWFT